MPLLRYAFAAISTAVLFGDHTVLRERLIPPPDIFPAKPWAIGAKGFDRKLAWQFLQAKFLNNILEQDHRRVKRLTRPGLDSVGSGRHDEHWRASRRWR